MCSLSHSHLFFYYLFFNPTDVFFPSPQFLSSSVLNETNVSWHTHTHTASPPLSPFVISPLFFLQAAQPDSIGRGTRTAPARVMLLMENLWLSPGEAFPYECKIRQRAAWNGINMQKHGSWEKGRVVAGGRGREKRTSPPSWMQSVELEHHEYWKIYWMERYDHGKSGKHRTGSMSREMPTELEEEASVLGRYHLLMQRGLRAEAGVKGAQDTVTAPSSLAGWVERSDALAVRRAQALRNKGPCSVPTKLLGCCCPRRRGSVCFSPHFTFSFDFKPLFINL